MNMMQYDASWREDTSLCTEEFPDEEQFSLKDIGKHTLSNNIILCPGGLDEMGNIFLLKIGCRMLRL